MSGHHRFTPPLHDPVLWAASAFPPSNTLAIATLCGSTQQRLSDSASAGNLQLHVNLMKLSSETIMSQPTDQPKRVTIGLPIYKRLEYLPHVLEIIAAQDHPNLDLLVSDNGMNGDRVREIVEACYFRPYRFRQNPATVISSQHFNQLLDEAEGDYFLLLCDDDEISPNYISELVGSLERFPEASVAIARQQMIAKDGSLVRESAGQMPEYLSGPDFINATWNDYSFGMEMVATFLVRSSKVKESGGFPDFCRGTGIDNAVLIKLLLNGGIALNSNCVFRWRLDDASYGWSVSYIELAKACKQFLKWMDADPVVLEFARANPAEWRRSRGILVRMTWDTYFGRWRDIYQSKLPLHQWILAAFAMPFIGAYYQLVARHLFSCLKSSLKSWVLPKGMRRVGKNPI